jgi:DNA processing protein
VRPATARRLVAADLAERAQRVLDRALDHGLHVVTPVDPEYPPRLRSLPLRPAILFLRRQSAANPSSEPDAIAQWWPEPALTVVGTRTPTPYGIQAARQFCAALAGAGLALVSGLALGVDALVHQVAIERGVATVAVLAGGLDRIYPGCHTELAARIVADGGILVSELPPGTAPRRASFPRRNRLLAGLGLGLLVIEAGRRSGSLSTANWANDYGRTVFAVPGPFGSPQSLGCHQLIADGAQIAIDPRFLLTSLAVEPGVLANATTGTAQQFLEHAGEQALRRVLAAGPMPFDQAARETLLDREQLLVMVVRLMAVGRLRRLPGNLLALPR